MEKIIVFKNGLRLVWQKMRSTKALSIGIYVGVGSMYEDKSNNGISHFIEHMTFKGTPTRSAYDIANELESIGVNVNAYTSKNLTAFYTTGLGEYGDKCMEILADIYYNSTYTQENLDKEREVVLEEIKMSTDDYEDLCLENLCKVLFGEKKSVAYPILGSKENVAKFNKDDIVKFMSKHYVPQNTVISITGNISEEEATALVDKYFDTTTIKSDYVKPKFVKEKYLSKLIIETKNENAQAHITIGFPAIGLAKSDNVVNSVVSNIIGGSMSSRLFQAIREEMGLVYTIYASTISYEKSGYMFIYLATDPTKVTQAITAVRKVLDNILVSGVEESELNKTIIQIKTAMTLGTEVSMSVMRANAKSAILLDKKFNLNSIIAKLDKLDKPTVDKYLKFYFDYDNASISYVGKKQEENIYNLFMGEK
ncbi:MAG: pitrilysin family protein [Clostridia bacterium]